MRIEKRILGSSDDHVYDISLDGTVVNALGMNVLSNTDGFNFQLPREFRYTEDKPYVSTGMNRNTKKGEKYTELAADVAEFNDLFMRGKMGLDVDEVIPSSINFSRKNYADYLMSKGEKKVKLVGNTIKSKKMPGYIEKFIDKGLTMLLEGEGQQFLNFYYDYVEKIYNFLIPLRDIASRGKIKKTVEQYKEDCKQLTKAGTPKARQAWYELVIANNVPVNLGDTVYYINTGTAKSHNDFKKITVKAKYDKKTGREISPERVEHKLYCKLLPREVVEADEDTFCDEYTEYNVAKYIDQFNKRIKPLLVCFSRDIRGKILITDPRKRNYFTEEECRLVAGQPNNPSDQDTYEQLMTPEDKEIKYWLSINEDPPFTKECGMDWDEIKKEYLERMERLRDAEMAVVVEEYAAYVEKATKEEVDKFVETGELPTALRGLVKIQSGSDALVDLKYGVKVGSVFDLLDKDFARGTDDMEGGTDEFEKLTVDAIETC